MADDPSARPNILLLMTDQQRWDALGCSGGWVETPHFDRIAREGVRFSHCVTNSPVCIPARFSLATGRYPHSTGIWANGHHTLAPETPTWMQAIRDAGYRTSLFGKTHLHPHQGDLRERESLLHAYGLDDVDEIGGPRASARVRSHMTAHWESRGLWEAYRDDFAERFSGPAQPVRPSVLPLEEYADVYVGRRAREYLRTYERDQPWFCWVSFGGPHEPWDTPEPYASRYDPASMPLPVSPDEGFSDPARPQGQLDERIRKAPPLDPDLIAAMRANYAGNVTLIDDQIGEILEVLERRGELANTVICCVSDHGEHNGDYGLVYKETFLNGAVRVPLILRTPETARSSGGGRVFDGPVEWIDVGPTLVESSGGSLTHRQFGRSLHPVLTDPGASHRDVAISEVRGEVMITDGRWKLAVNDQGKPYLLFDLESDPGETRNRVSDPAAADDIQRLRFRLQEELVRTQVQAGE